METPIETNNPGKRQVKIYIFLLILFVAVFGLGFAIGEGKVRINNGKIEINKGNQPATSADYSLLWETLDELNAKYVDRPLDQNQLMYGAVSGMVEATGDPYTTFLNPDEAKAFQEQLRGSFEGIGAEIGIKDDQMVIIAPLEDTPASRAGLLAGDSLLDVNGESTHGMTVEKAVSKIRGRAGTQVKLTILHQGQSEPQEISITRDKIQIKSVKLDTKEIDGHKIAIIKMNQFGDDTKDLLNQATDNVLSGNFSGVILDLRNNSGGYLQTAVTTISNWIDSGQLAVKEIGFDKTEKSYNTSGVARLKGMKTVVLVNGGSASASEIVAGALQDYQVATLVGEKTFGKGSVQELIDLKDSSELKVTVAKWFTPKGRGIHNTGLEPDMKVERSSDDIKNNKDPQMDKALELLK